MQPLNEIKNIDITKIMISLRKAKPEWFSPMVMKSYEPYII